MENRCTAVVGLLLIEPRCAAPQQHIHLMIDHLFRDRSWTTSTLPILRTSIHVGGPLAGAAVDVRGKHRRRRVRQLGRRHVAGAISALLRDFQNRRPVAIVGR